LVATRARQRPWFTPRADRRWTLPSLFPTAAYGVAGAAALWPLVPHALAWIWGEAVLDVNWIVLWVTVYVAWAAFAGMLRTLRRLNTGKGNWQDDHILVHALPGLLLVAETARQALVLRGIQLLDLVGMAFCGMVAGAIGGIALVFGVMASFGLSFLFVYIAVMRNHTGEVDG
jgi:hypothetical protein